MGIKHTLTIMACAMTALAQTAFAQTEVEAANDEARQMISQMSAEMKAHKTITSAFSLCNDNKQTGEKIEMDGTLTVSGDKYVIDLPDISTLSDGKTVAVWQKKISEVDLSDYEENDESMTPTKFFGAYEKGYKMRILGKTTISGTQCTEVDLYPTDAKSPLVRVRLTIDTKSKQLKQFMQQSKSGQTMTVKFSSFTFDLPVSENIFTFDTKSHPNVEVVDLR